MRGVSKLLAGVFRPGTYLLDRVVGLTDDEMLWEPATGCLSVREIDGVWRDDPPPRRAHFAGHVSPVATIGWRLVHIARDVLTSERNATWLGVEAPPPPRPAEGVPGDAATMVRWVQDAHSWWSDIIEGCDDEQLLSPIGAIAGRWDGPRAGFAAYTNMELIHHGAEVGLLRDLWAARRQPGGVAQPVPGAVARNCNDEQDRHRTALPRTPSGG